MLAWPARCGGLRNARRSAPSARTARRLESFGCLSEDADVWAIVAGAAVSVWRSAFGRLSLRFGTEIVLHSPAVEPGAHPLIGAGGRIGQRFGVAASIDRAPEFTLMRAGFFVGEVPAALYAGIQKSSLYASRLLRRLVRVCGAPGSGSPGRTGHFAGGVHRLSPATAAGKGTDAAPVSAQRSGRAPQVSACEPDRELIAAALGRGRNAMAIWRDLVDPAPSTRASTLQKVSTKWRTTPTARRPGHAAHRAAWPSQSRCRQGSSASRRGTTQQETGRPRRGARHGHRRRPRQSPSRTCVPASTVTASTRSARPVPQ